MKVAIVHDCLTVYGGAERLLKQLITLFPEADLYSVIDFFPENLRHHFKQKKAETTFIQKLPLAKRCYQYYLPLMPLAIEQLDLKRYDLILSSHYAVAKGVLVAPHQLHICYCHSPLRSAWDLQAEYFKENRVGGIKGLLMRRMLHSFRLWDVASANRVDHFVSNSRFVKGRIEKSYRRDATVIYSGIELENFPFSSEKEDFYLTASRLVPYKRVDLIVEAFSRMPKRRLYVIGEGSEFRRLKKKASANVTLLGWQSAEALKGYLQRARAFLFAAKEDFGLMPLEAQATGTPVIAFGQGGALETVRGLNLQHPTGCFFYEQTSEAILEAVELFEKNQTKILPSHCRMNAEQFSDHLFRQRFHRFVLDKYEEFKSRESPRAPSSGLPLQEFIGSQRDL